MTDKSRRLFMINAGEMAIVCASFAFMQHRAHAEALQSITVDRSSVDLKAGADCTALLQRAIDQLPVTGGEVLIPAGEYLIDAVLGVKLRSHVSLRLLPGAILRAKPTAAPNYAILRIFNVVDVRIKGGNLVGERSAHLGRTGEWGMGIDIRGSHAVHIETSHISDCWGDGIYIGSSAQGDVGTCSDITVKSVICENNRRQGLTIVACDGALIERCEFNHTKGTAPSAGIDIEPNRGQTVKNVRIVDCKATHNAGDGFQLYAAAAGAAITDCSITGGVSNANLGSGVSLAGTSGSKVSGMSISDNAHHGVFVGASAVNSEFSGNKIVGNDAESRGMSLAALIGAMKVVSLDGVFVEKGARGTKVESKEVKF
ncbi:MAG: right-handed parallel beta-helix repeat-containing protein [Granulicella sp.]